MLSSAGSTPSMSFSRAFSSIFAADAACDREPAGADGFCTGASSASKLRGSAVGFGAQASADDAETRCNSLASTPVSSHLSAASFEGFPAQVGLDAYAIDREVLGAGRRGVVLSGVVRATGRSVAVKQLYRDADCPVRFLEVRRRGAPSLNIEGRAPRHSLACAWRGRLVFDKDNEFASVPLPFGSVLGCVLLVRRGGGTTFAEKLQHACAGGAVGVVLINTVDKSVEYSLGEVDAAVPSMMVSRSDGDSLLALATQIVVPCGFSPSPRCAKAERDGRSPRADTADGCGVSKSCAAGFGAEGNLFSEAWAEVRTDIAQEVAICNRLPACPHVLEVLDAWEEHHIGFCVMELCTGGTIASRLRGGCYPLATALRLTRELLLAVEALHDAGICHRDLSPQNLLLSAPLEVPGSRLVVSDFSMAALATRMTVPCGSARYIAPEVLAGSYDRQCDVWSAGVLACEFIFGRHPFGDASEDELLECLASDVEPVLLSRGARDSSQIPEDVYELVAGLLQRDPRRRMTAAMAVQHSAFWRAAPPSVAPEV